MGLPGVIVLAPSAGGGLGVWVSPLLTLFISFLGMACLGRHGIRVALGRTASIWYLVLSACLAVGFFHLQPFFGNVFGASREPGIDAVEAISASMILIAFGPIAEELAFRGTLLIASLSVAPSGVAIGINAMFFAFCHGPDCGLASVLVLGILCSVLRVVSGSIYPSIVMHSFSNALVMFHSL
jgi:membrane protease YdiL (CAAX protease family)